MGGASSLRSASWPAIDEGRVTRRPQRDDLVIAGDSQKRPAAVTSWLTPDAVAALRQRGTYRRFPRGRSLFLEGDRSDWAAYLEKGQVKLSTLTREGKESVMAVVGAGELLGELSAVDGEPRSATATALEPVEAVIVDAAAFVHFLEEEPRAAIGILRHVSGRLRTSDRRRAEFGGLDTISRLARLLVELADQYGEEDDGGVRIALALSQEELAGWTGSSREAVVKALRELRERGWIATARREIRIVDVPALIRRAQ